MKKLKLIYNPLSGDAAFKNKLDHVIAKFQKSGYSVVPFRLDGEVELDAAFEDINEDYHAIAVSGGDGSVNSVINMLVKNKIDIPVGIFPSGTSNDLASFLGIPRDIDSCCDIITGGAYKLIDIGLVNGCYFANVCSAGLLTDVAYKTDTAMKNTLGQLAYYIRGVEEIPRFSPVKMKITYENKTIEDNMLMILVLNSSSAGGFNKLAPDAQIDDGKLDVIAIKYSNITNMLALFLKILRGEHISDSLIYHLQTDKLAIQCDKKYETDVDGERGPDFPLEISVKHKALRIFVPDSIK